MVADLFNKIGNSFNKTYAQVVHMSRIFILLRKF